MENDYTPEKLVLFAISVPKIFAIGRNLTKFGQKISLHSFLRHGVRRTLQSMIGIARLQFKNRQSGRVKHVSGRADGSGVQVQKFLTPPTFLWCPSRRVLQK